MNSTTESWVASLGFLRLALFALAILNMLISILHLQLSQAAEAYSTWGIIAVYVTPVMAPIFVVVILFDYVMSRVRAADAEGLQRSRYRNIGRLELALIAVTLLYWIPFFVSLLG